MTQTQRKSGEVARSRNRPTGGQTVCLCLSSVGPGDSHHFTRCPSSAERRSFHVFAQRLSYAFMLPHKHRQRSLSITARILFPSSTEPNSPSAFWLWTLFGFSCLFLLWELGPLHRLECAYLVGKPVREETETDVRERRKRGNERVYVVEGVRRLSKLAKRQRLNWLIKQIY